MGSSYQDIGKNIPVSLLLSTKLKYGKQKWVGLIRETPTFEKRQNAVGYPKGGGGYCEIIIPRLSSYFTIYIHYIILYTYTILIMYK